MTPFNITRAFNQMEARGWQQLYWLIDLHDTIIEGKYDKFNEGRSFYPGAQEVLAYLTSRPDMKLILWTSSYQDAIDDILAWLATYSIRFDAINANPFEQSNKLCDFTAKPYFNILLDDKAGFCGATDWAIVRAELELVGVNFGEYGEELKVSA